MTGERRQQQAARDAADRRRRMAAIFGDPLPERTRDEVTDAGRDDDTRGGPGDDDWLRSQVPPHHG